MSGREDQEGYVLGIDLGGTTVSVAAVRRSGSGGGSIGATVEGSIKSAAGPEKGLALIGDLMEEVAHKEGGKPLAFGLGATGPIIREKGIIDNPYTLPGWNQVDAVGALSRRTGLIGTMENDADAFALGEWWAGAAKAGGADGEASYGPGTRLYAMTIGTGIGTAFVEGGKLYRGLGGFHPEGGHMVIDPCSGPACYCGAKGCLESLVSGTGISRAAAEAAAREGGLMLALADGDSKKVDSRTAVTAARRGDPVALALMERIGTYIGLGLVNVMSILLPEVIVIGGGLAAEFDLLRPAVERTVDKANVMIPAKDVAIKVSGLGRQGGMLGAAYAAFEEIKARKGMQS